MGKVLKSAARIRTDQGVRALVGPTGVGKSAAATALARDTGAPVLVADRIQCFTDLLVTSGRAADAQVPGVDRIWLSDRTVGDGDYAPSEASKDLLSRLESLVTAHGLVVLEGGSICLLLNFAERLESLPYSVSVNVLPIPNRSHYPARQIARARKMLVPDSSGRSLLTEFAAAWRTPGQRRFAVSVSGLDSICEWCAKHSVEPEEVAKVDFSEKMLGELSTMLGERYAAHGFTQERLFQKAFDNHVRNSPNA
ncbi:isopentenyl transferase family protein [Streptomyces graminilatus]|uniref:isopentenyl transferase family protein n=1 Tax=Streptomyces graminilatus TaxID=1464070 RepID=UPI0006E385E6|nr:isopentenyl transferase family protein [Streptomyces graminilatus]